MHPLAIIVIGFIIGVLAKWIFPGRAPHGFVMTTLVGIGGAVLAAVVGHLGGWYGPHHHAGLIASVGGAIVVLALYRHIVPRREDPELDE